MDINQLCDLIRQVVSIESDDAELSKKHLLSDLGICSFDMMVILVQIERMYGLEVDTSQIQNDISVMDFCNVINNRSQL